ncbi:CPBP family intramembrane metalloprotease [Altererythrobacter salegens]|uniref:CPBP family intramembrane metalloprotease n=1 Tax=Croceibacterium salegens TaxID=1737568 RepID=A0A6I4STC2_9SPHN|nr:CPBP family intramembrane glutamic endopeptidase [Croceibacterium salegens]MXO59234.1 CPBP family intramembrane metalloprotease [Croceibacterium salegens]
MNARLVRSLGVYVLWILVTLYGAKFLLGGEEAALDELVKNGVGWQFVAAIVVLLGAIAGFRWRDMKFGAPHSLVKVMWFPVLVLLAISSLAAVTGFPGGRAALFILLNTMLVGFSEEVMFRGVLFRALLENVRVWTAIVVTTVLFGGIHVLNGVNTGEWGMASLQAVAAGMSGLIFIAIVIRTGSIWPAIIYHGVWDCMLFLIKVGSEANGMETDPELAQQMMSGPTMFLPMLLALPNFVCALILLRKVRDADFPRGDAVPVVA